MIRDEGWLELVEVVPMTTPNNNGGTNVTNSSCNNIRFPKASGDQDTAIHVFCSRDDNNDDNDEGTILPLTSIVVQASSALPEFKHGEEKEDNNDDTTDVADSCNYEESSSPHWLLRLHPVMFFFLHHASCTCTARTKIVRKSQPDDSQIRAGSNKDNDKDKDNKNNRVRIAPLPMLEFQSFQPTAQQEHHQKEQKCSWKSRPVIVEELKKGSHIHVSCVYVEDDEPWATTSSGSAEDETKTNDSNNRRRRRMTVEQAIGIALEGRIVRAGSVLLLSTIHGYVIASVTNISTSTNTYHGKITENSIFSRAPVYRLSDDVLADYHCHIHGPPVLYSEQLENESSSTVWEQDVPGYEMLLKEIMDVFRVHGDTAASSGVVLTGCAGVGKSRMASCVARHFSDGGTFHQQEPQEQQHQHQPSEMTVSKSKSNQASLRSQNNIYYLSVQDLIFQASVETNLLENVLVPKLRGCKLWIIDDLNLLETPDGGGDEVKSDAEIMMVQNAIVEAIDRFHLACCILGLAQSVVNLPSELTKFGRLEKAFQMLQPTQLQRIELWKRILADGNDGGSFLNDDDSPYANNNEWVVTLASSTAGCVPRDLLRIYRDAKTKVHSRRRECEINCENHPVLEWEDLREAIKSAVPSQLSELDVIKPILFEKSFSWKEIHLRSWQRFAGYPSLKKSAYRQVVVPWRFFLQSLDESLTGEIKENEKSWLEPPPGVLFHGISGTGKTVAAKCLAVSLGLPIIQVRATDLLDKWLGGSESLLRSLFTRARAVSPCVLFLDEIDAIACNREEDDNNDVSSRILSTLLNEMDGVSSAIQKSRVLVIACTNRIQSIDSALLRPGRLQEHFRMGNPDVSDLEAILKLRMGEIPMGKNLSLKNLALELFEREATGADVGGLCREATFIAMRRVGVLEDNNVAVTQEDFKSAIIERFGS